ncbi:MerR family transcriptional regulator [Streptosporangium sp. NPDC000396]|uniref:MerR family transcriptional regulator n=1 Tax=Streptosporangium sp. NPDC000396 TaxID=3366185 RepID=UPI0036BD5FF0
MEWLTIGAFSRASRLSQKALRLYDELGLLVPARTDPFNGYRLYDPAQLDRARLVAWLRRLDMPLARIKAVCDLPPGQAAGEVAAYWARAERKHTERAELAALLVEHLSGRTSHMFDVKLRHIRERVIICAKRHLTADELAGFAMELTRRAGDGTVPALPGLDGAPFLIYHGEVGADSDGPVEWCRPVPADHAQEIAARFPDLELRTDPAHTEAFVRLCKGRLDAAHSLRALQTLGAWERAGEFTGPPRQVFFADPRTAGEDEPVSDMVAPLPE